MFHPFAEDTSDMTVSQLQDRLSELSAKYFKTQNPQVREQMATLLDFYKQEILIKTEKERLEQQNSENGNLDLDNLIKVN